MAGLVLGRVVWLVAPLTLVAIGAHQDSGLVIAADAHLTTAVGGLERTSATATVVPVSGASFAKALRVTIAKPADETNATQLTMPIQRGVSQGDVMMADFWLRGGPSSGQGRIEFLFERTLSPWTKSVMQPATSAKDAQTWKHVLIPFQSAESYKPGEAMVSIRFATQPQTVEVGGLTVTNYAKSKTLDELNALVLRENPLGSVQVDVDFKTPRQTLMGLGGNFCQPRYGSTEPMDAVGQYVLMHLDVRHARIGLPLNNWTPEPGVYRDIDQARAALLTLRQMAQRKVPTVVSIWEGPGWMLAGKPEQNGRVLPPEKYGICIDAIVKFLTTARDKYEATVEYVTFNEPDYGINFKFSSKEMADFIRQAGPKLVAAGLKTKFAVGDTGNGSNFYSYAKPLLEDKSIAAYLGPISFHGWDSLTASDEAYTRIADLGHQYNKPIWCLEAGHDPGLWEKKDPWNTWENALRTAMAYERTLRLTQATLIDYWTYQDNYPLVDKTTLRPYQVFKVMEDMEGVFAKGARVATSRTSNPELQAIATSGPRRGQFGVLVVNPSGKGEVTIGGLPPSAKVRVKILADASTNVDSGRTTDSKGRIMINLPARSVVTVQTRVNR